MADFNERSSTGGSIDTGTDPMWELTKHLYNARVGCLLEAVAFVFCFELLIYRVLRQDTLLSQCLCPNTGELSAAVWVILEKMGHTWKNVSHNSKTGSYVENCVTLGKMHHAWKNGSHLQKCVTFPK